jgi:hypothetical protein
MSDNPSSSISAKNKDLETLIELLKKDKAFEHELPKIEKIFENVFSYIIDVKDKHLIEGKIPCIATAENSEISADEILLYNNIFKCLNKLFVSHFHDGVLNNQVDDKTILFIKCGIGSENFIDYIRRIFLEELRSRQLAPNNNAKIFFSKSLLEGRNPKTISTSQSSEKLIDNNNTKNKI